MTEETEKVDVKETPEAPKPVPTVGIHGAPWVMILGTKGAGKTRLAATLSNTLVIDTEPPGSASAFPEEYRCAFTPSNTMYQEVTELVGDIVHNFQKTDRGISWHKWNINALCIDTFDTLQRFLITRFLSQKAKPSWVKEEIWAPKMEMQDWGTILNYQTPLITELKMLPVPVILVVHTKEEDPLYKGTGDYAKLIKKGKRGPDVSGSIENFILNLCDYVLNIVVGEDGVRTVYTQPTIVDDYVIVAADRHRLFKNEKQNISSFDLPVGEDGFPVRKVLDYICKAHAY